jgi:hypothetical protein
MSNSITTPYSKTRKPISTPRKRAKPYNRPSGKSKEAVLYYDMLIDDIIRSSNSDIHEKAARYVESEKKVLIGFGGLPTDTYKRLLTRIVERFEDFNATQLRMISQLLFTWEESALTGIMKVYPDEEIYSTYRSLLQAVFGDPIPFLNSDKSIDLANSTIVHTIQEIEKSCSFGASCTRANPLHKHYMHEMTKVGGRRRTIKRRKTRKHRTHSKQ